MTYSMASLSLVPQKEKEQRSLIELVQDTTRTYVIAGTIAQLVRQKREQMQTEANAKEAMQQVVEGLSQEQDQEEESGKGTEKILWKIMKFVGKRIFKYIVRPILNFAARVAMNLIRYALRVLVTWVIEPIIAVIAGFAVANPITAAIAAVLAVSGVGYWIWSEFFQDKAKPKAPEVDTTNVAEADNDLEEGPQARTTVTAPSQTYEKTARDYVAAPLNFVKQIIGTSKTTNKFEGFGSDVDSYIKEASAMFGLPEDVLRGFIKMEGGWTGKMSPTGAIGTGQFIQSTWDGLAATPEGRAIGMTKIGSRFRKDDDPRFDKRVNTLATALLARDNARILQKNGLPLTGENLYMLHNIGPGIIQVMLGREASPATLKAMQQNGMLAGQTAADFLVYQKGRFNAQYTIANTGGASSKIAAADQPKMADAVTVEKQKSQQVTTVASASGTGSTSSSRNPDKDIVRGKGKTLIEVT